MSQFTGSPQAAIDYNIAIIGALELSEKKWVLAVQLPGVDRHSRLCLGRLRRHVSSFVERLKARCAAAGREIGRVILTHEAGRDGFWLARFLARRGSRFTSCSPRASPWIGGRGRRRTDIIDVEMLLHTLDGSAEGRASGVFDGPIPSEGDEEARRAYRERED